jgi:serine/threonine protein kinase
LPDFLLQLPSLAWLAYADNPLNEAGSPESHTPDVRWADLQLGEVLGQGASGIIHRAEWQRPDGQREAVALKLFKGQMTSDGKPQSEMAACLTVGQHANLISAIGRVVDHPQGEQGLLLSLVEPRFSILAGPPSLESCSRDVYSSDWHASFSHALRIACGIASALRHLHARGVTHGDLYGHNILIDETGNALLGDFGAASFLPVAAPAQHGLLQRIEVRAFGILLEELMQRCEVPGEHAAQLAELVRRCQQPQVSARPDFIEIDVVLAGLFG